MYNCKKYNLPINILNLSLDKVCNYCSNCFDFKIKEKYKIKNIQITHIEKFLGAIGFIKHCSVKYILDYYFSPNNSFTYNICYFLNYSVGNIKYNYLFLIIIALLNDNSYLNDLFSKNLNFLNNDPIIIFINFEIYKLKDSTEKIKITVFNDIVNNIINEINRLDKFD